MNLCCHYEYETSWYTNLIYYECQPFFPMNIEPFFGKIQGKSHQTKGLKDKRSLRLNLHYALVIFNHGPPYPGIAGT